MATQITLLKDAEGREIPLNTTALYDKDGKRREVDWFKFYPDKDRWDIVLKDSYVHFSPHSLSLTPPDGWEKLLEDLHNAANAPSSKVCAYYDVKSSDCSFCPAVTEDSCTGAIFKNIAARIRKLRGEE